MSPRTGRPTQNKKTERLEIRLTPEEAQRLEKCAQKMQASKTNDGLSGSAPSIGTLLSRKYIYFVPFGQDDPHKKPTSLVAD